MSEKIPLPESRPPESKKEEYRHPAWEFWPPEKIKTAEQAALCLFWVPRKKDILKILEIAKQAHGEAKEDMQQELWILDVGGRSGFIDKLLVDAAREQGIELHVVVLDPDQEILKQANGYYKEHGEDNLHFVISRSQEAPALFNRKFDLVINSWMQGAEGEDIRKIDTKARVYVRDRSEEGATGLPEDFEAGAGWKRYGSWLSLAHSDVEKEQRGDFKNYREKPERLEYFKMTLPAGPKERSSPWNVIEVHLPDNLAKPEFESKFDDALNSIDSKRIGKKRLYRWEQKMEPDYPYMRFRKGHIWFGQDVKEFIQ